jgi:hypothetical protein
MRIFFRAGLIIIISLFIVSVSHAQETSRDIRFGFGFLIGKQNIFPFNDLNYSHSQRGYRLQFNFPLRTGKLSFELQFEPSVYIAEHQLLNPYFIQPSDAPDYLHQREYYTQHRTITDFALNIGVVTRYNFNKHLSSYFLFSTGPTWLNTRSERQANGFAFSNVLSVGIAYKTGKFRFEFGPGVRHVSNANTHYPNGGHNSSTLDFGIAYTIGKVKPSGRHNSGAT